MHPLRLGVVRVRVLAGVGRGAVATRNEHPALHFIVATVAQRLVDAAARLVSAFIV